MLVRPSSKLREAVDRESTPLWREFPDVFDSTNSGLLKRAQLVQMAGKQSVPAFFLAGLFVEDLLLYHNGFYYNGYNWGASGGRLTVIDMDESHRSLDGFCDIAPQVTEQVSMYFSFEDITLMRELLTVLDRSPKPRFHELEDMPDISYHFLVRLYLNAVDSAVSSASAIEPIMMHKDAPSGRVNHFIRRAFLAARSTCKGMVDREALEAYLHTNQTIRAR